MSHYASMLDNDYPLVLSVLSYYSTVKLSIISTVSPCAQCVFAVHFFLHSIVNSIYVIVWGGGVYIYRFIYTRLGVCMHANYFIHF